MDKRKRHGVGQDEKGETSFNLGRMRKAIQSGHRVVPVGLSADELIEWISRPSDKNDTDR